MKNPLEQWQTDLTSHSAALTMFFGELPRQLLIFQGDTSDGQMVSYVWFKLITCRSLVLIVAYLDIIL